MLPSDFLSRMERILGKEYPAFAASYSQPYYRGARINTLKMPLDHAALLGICGDPSPFSPLGFYISPAGNSESVPAETRVGHMPYHHAGAFYSQEPSAMSAVTALDPQKGEYILDMCAAPGGKATQIAALLDGKGLLVANEYVRSRAEILISNIERMGITNAAVTSLRPDKLAAALPGCFDRVLVDAPCSGEGMFRRDARAVSEWSPEHVTACAARQAAILDSAAECVRDGGVLVYSTCTFSPEENELCVAAFLERHDDFEIEPIEAGFGRSALDVSGRFDTSLARRVYPMDGGEGHFAARMRKRGCRTRDRAEPARSFDGGNAPGSAADMLLGCLNELPEGTLKRVNDNIYLLPPEFAALPDVPVVRAGILAGELKKGRAEPSHALFMSRAASRCRTVADLAADSDGLKKFLRGEELECSSEYSGYAAVCCSGIVTGFGKCSGGRLKNRYPKGLRDNGF